MTSSTTGIPNVIDGYCTLASRCGGTEDVPHSKYNLHQRVSFRHPSINIGIMEGKITYVSETGQGVEYGVDTFGFLLWEHEIIEVLT